MESGRCPRAGKGSPGWSRTSLCYTLCPGLPCAARGSREVVVVYPGWYREEGVHLVVPGPGSTPGYTTPLTAAADVIHALTADRG